MASESSPKSEKGTVPTVDSFDENFKNFMEAVLELRRAKTDAFAMSKTEDPYWVKCITNLYTVFMGTEDYDDFKEMFTTFFIKYKKNLIANIFSNDGINDGWLKNKEVLPTPFSNGKETKRGKGNFGWATQQKLEGIVLYLDPTDKDMRSYCIPISKIYIEACTYYDEQYEKNGGNSHLPATILYSFYSIIASVCPSNKVDIDKNVKIIKQIVDELSPAKKDEDSSFSPMKGMIKMLAKNSGMSTDDTHKFTSAFDKIFSAETAKKVGNAVKSVSDSLKSEVGDDPTKNIDSMLSKIGDALQKSELRDLLVDQAKQVADLQASIPTAETPSGASVSSEASSSSSASSTSAEPSSSSTQVGADEQE